MKEHGIQYNININQYELHKTKLDLVDCAILDYLKKFCGVDDKRVKQLTITEEGKMYQYTWINFNYLIKQMPLLRIKSKSTISSRIQKIERAGFIKTFRAPDRSLYVRLAEKIKDIDYYSEEEKERGVRETEQGVRRNEQEVFAETNSTIIVPINNNTSNNISKEIQAKPDSYGNKDINKIYDYLKEKISGTPDGTIKENRRFAKLLLDKFRKDYPNHDPAEVVCTLIDISARDDFHSKNSTSFKYLYYNSQKIIKAFKGRNNKYIKL